MECESANAVTTGKNPASAAIRSGYQDGNITVEKSAKPNAFPDRSVSARINVGYQEGNIDVRQHNASYSRKQPGELPTSKPGETAGVEPMESSVVAQDFHRGHPSEESPVFNLRLESKNGFEIGSGTIAEIHVTNCSSELMQDVVIIIEGVVPDTLSSHDERIVTLPSKAGLIRRILMVPRIKNIVLVRIKIHYSDVHGKQFEYYTVKQINVAADGALRESGPQQIINNTFTVGYIEGDISTLQPMDVTNVQKTTHFAAPESSARPLKCRCGLKIEPLTGSCPKCGMMVITNCPKCMQRVDSIDLTCRCGHELHQAMKLKLRKLNSIGSRRAMLTVQHRGSGQTDWSDPIRYLLIQNPKWFKLGRCYKLDDEKSYNDVVLLVHCLDEPTREQWKDKESLTWECSKGISRRQMDISFKNDRFHITWIKGHPRNKYTGIFLEKQKSDHEKADKTDLCCKEEYMLSDGDIIGIRGQIQFRFRSFKGDVQKVGKVVGACLERRTGVLDLDRPIRYGEYEHYYRAYYLFPSVLCIGGEGTEGLILDIPGIAANRFHIVEYEGKLKLIDRHRENPKPREKIECF